MCKHHDCRQRVNLSKRLLRVGDRYVICCKRPGTGAKNGVAEQQTLGPGCSGSSSRRLQQYGRRREVNASGGCAAAAIITAAFVYCGESVQPAQVLLQKIGFRMFISPTSN
jgi:hypothetical protein